MSSSPRYQKKVNKLSQRSNEIQSNPFNNLTESLKYWRVLQGELYIGTENQTFNKGVSL